MILNVNLQSSCWMWINCCIFLRGKHVLVPSCTMSHKIQQFQHKGWPESWNFWKSGLSYIILRFPLLEVKAGPLKGNFIRSCSLVDFFSIPISIASLHQLPWNESNYKSKVRQWQSFQISCVLWFISYRIKHEPHQLPITSGGRRAPSFPLDEWPFIDWNMWRNLGPMMRHLCRFGAKIPVFSMWSFLPGCFAGHQFSSFAPCRARIASVLSFSLETVFRAQHRTSTNKEKKTTMDQNMFWNLLPWPGCVFKCMMGQSHCTRHCLWTFE